MATILTGAIAGYLLFDSIAAAKTALFGVVAGLIGGVLAQKDRSHITHIVIALALESLLLPLPDVASVCVGIALAAIAGWETVKFGGRGMVFGLWVWMAIQVMPDMPPAPVAVSTAIIGLAFGWAVARWFKLEGIAAPPPAIPYVGVALFMFLTMGLGVSLLIMGRAEDQPYSYWIPLFFVLRAIAPPQKTVQSAAKFGVGAVLGCLAAFGLMFLQLPSPIIGLLVLGLFVLGFRNVPNPLPITPAAFSAAIMLGAFADLQTSIFRMEVAVFVAVFSAFLAVAFDAFWVWFHDRNASHQIARNRTPGS